MRRRARFVEAVALFSRGVLIAAPVGLLLLLAARLSPWVRYLAPYLFAVGTGITLGLFAYGWARQRMDRGYCAKWMDLESGLEDRLTSAVEWAALPERSPFQEKCIEQLALGLGARRWQLVEPRPRLTQPALTVLCAALWASAAALALRPAPRPVAIIENNAKSKVVMAESVATATGKEATEIQTQVSSLRSQELDALSVDLATLVKNVGQGEIDRETSMKRIEALRKKVDAVSQLAATLKSGALDQSPTGELARALRSGELPAVEKALSAMSESMKGGALVEEERERAEHALDMMAGLAETSEQPALAGKLKSAARRLAASDQKGAGEELGSAIKEIAKLDRAIKTLAVAQRIDKAVDALEDAVQATAANPSAAAPDRGGKATGTDGQSSPGGKGGKDNAGMQGVTEYDPQGLSPTATKGDDLQLNGTWNGKVVRQLFQAGPGAEVDEEAKRMLVEHRRVVEDRFRRDDIPEAYQASIRAYFEALNQKEKEWTQSKK